VGGGGGEVEGGEEEGREVESQMELVVPGAPVSVLADHGLTDEIAAKLIEGGVNTVEKLGAMTPEELQALPGIDAATVERIQQAVVSYYGQFEEAAGEEDTAGEETAAGEDVAGEENAAAGENEAAAEAAAEPESAIPSQESASPAPESAGAAEGAEASLPPEGQDQGQEKQEQSVTMDAEEL
jgi:transcription termination/antitermination protein NusA